MRHHSSHHRLGAGLASCAALSGIVAVMLGWVTPGELPSFAPDRTFSETVAPLGAPVRITVTTLPAGPASPQAPP